MAVKQYTLTTTSSPVTTEEMMLVAALLHRYGLEVNKVENNSLNNGKTPLLVLTEAIKNRDPLGRVVDITV